MAMTNVEQLTAHYQTLVYEQNQLLQQLSSKIRVVGWGRLVVFLATGALLYFFWGQPLLAVLAAVLGVVLFLVLVKTYGRLVARRDLVQNKISIAQDELRALAYDYASFDGASERNNPSHFFSLDLDVFGSHSLFQYINRTTLKLGKNRLADYFDTPLTDKVQIESRQEAIKELRGRFSMMLNWRAAGRDTKHDFENSHEAAALLSKQFEGLSYNTFWRWVTLVTPLLYLAIIVLVALEVLAGGYLLLLWVITLVISSIKIKHGNRILGAFEKKIEVLDRYALLLGLIEDSHFKSGLLQSLQGRIAGQTKASAAVRALKGYCSNLGQSFAFPMLLILNPALMWNIKYAIKIEQWHGQYGQQIALWLEAVAEFEALISLGTFAYNHPAYPFPTLADSFRLQGQELGHPLMHRDTMVTNDIQMSHSPYFVVITGANMAGKSTYLRTIGVNYLLACMGAPVCARSLSIYPSTLITSLRTSDSLNKSESYFFAELKRLKQTLDLLKEGKQPFIILDEILKGTNSLDKQKGSMALVDQLVSMEGTGIIATHDLMLGELEKKYPNHVKNYCFEAEIEGDHLHFTYKIKEGVAQNMNACFLMRQMGISV